MTSIDRTRKPAHRRHEQGRVILVGAGPGAADLLTLRAVRALGEADLVLYDALVDPQILDYAPNAIRHYVGKRAGRPNIAQERIHAIMIRAARAGRVVVRLKCGDPFVLGRGGEEAIALEEAKIKVEVVPGLSSAIAAPGAAGIPVTHRDLAPGVLVLSAVPSKHYECVLSALPPGSVTVVLLMAIGGRATIANYLRSVGWPGELPAAIVLDATLPSSFSWTGMLADLGHTPLPMDAGSAGLIVLGPVVSLAATISRATRSYPSNKENQPWPMERQAH